MNRYQESSTSSDYFHKLSLGEIPNHSIVYKFGRNPSVSATPTLIGSGGIYGLPTTAQTVTVTSTDATNDVFPAGSGARTVEVIGLDSNWDEVSEIINMGATGSQLFLRVIRAKVATAGTITLNGGANSGVVTVKQSTSAIKMVEIEANAGQTLIACYTVPSGYKALMWSADTTTGEGKNSVNTLKSRDNTIPNSPFQSKGIRDNFQNSVGAVFKSPNPYTEKTDIVFTTVSTASGTPVSGTFLLELIKLV